MKVAPDSIAVIRTQMPYLDRRALSEAWFSALHLARDVRLAVPQRRACDPGRLPLRTHPAATVRADRTVELRPSRGEDAPRASRGRAVVSPEDKNESRVSRARIALERARAAIPPPLDVRFTLQVAGVRVRMLVRRDGAVLRIAAICAASHVDAVRAAMTSAETAMRLRGQVLELSVRAAERAG